MHTPSTVVLKWLQAILQTYRHQNCLHYAAALAFDTALSLVPCLILITWGASHIQSIQPYFSNIQVFLIQHLLNQPDSNTQTIIHSFLKASHQLPRFELCVLLWVVWLLWNNIQSVFNHLFNVQTPRGVGFRSLLTVLLLLALPILLSIGFTLSSNIHWTITFIPQDTQIALTLTLLNTSLALSILYALFKWVPHCTIPKTAAFIGSLLTWIALELIKHLLVWYFSYQSLYRDIYGSFAAIPIFLLWLYVAWLIILLGAAATQVTRMYTQQGTFI